MGSSNSFFPSVNDYLGRPYFSVTEGLSGLILGVERRNRMERVDLRVSHISLLFWLHYFMILIPEKGIFLVWLQFFPPSVFQGL